MGLTTGELVSTVDCECLVIHDVSRELIKGTHSLLAHSPSSHHADRPTSVHPAPSGLGSVIILEFQIQLDRFGDRTILGPVIHS